jgi:hypothetical protein
MCGKFNMKLQCQGFTSASSARTSRVMLKPRSSYGLASFISKARLVTDRLIRYSLVSFAMTVAMPSSNAVGQSVSEPDEPIMSANTASTPGVSNFVGAKWPGPIIYIADLSGRLGTVELATGKVVALGNLGRQLTDITFCPNQKLYGVSFTHLYEITRSPLTLRQIGSFGSLGINALTCDRQNRLIAHSNTVSRLYRLSLTTGAATLIGNTGVYRSAGDLVFHEQDLLLTSTANSIVDLNPANGSVQGNVFHGISNLYGLISIGPNELIGCAGTNVYRVNRTTGATSLLGNYVSAGLGSCAGAAFNGNFR